MLNWAMDCGIQKMEKNECVYYTLTWSALRKADRWDIARAVPAMGGVYELYWMDEHRHLRLYCVGNANIGGLRSEIRRRIDPELTTDAELKIILSDRELFYRYCLIDYAADMADVLWFFRATYFPEDPGASHSGRYHNIYIKEQAPDKVRWVD